MVSKESEVNSDSFKKAMATWPTGVAIITSSYPDGSQNAQPMGILCNSITSLSVNQKLLLWTLDHNSSAYQFWQGAQEWIVHFLAHDQIELVKRFAQKGLVDRFEGLTYEKSPQNIPIFDGVVMRLHCQTVKKIDLLDHTIIMGEITEIEQGKGVPMVYGNRRFTSLNLPDSENP